VACTKESRRLSTSVGYYNLVGGFSTETSWWHIFRTVSRTSITRLFAFDSHTIHTCVGKVKVKCTLLQALRLCTGRTSHKGSRGIALLFLDHGTRREWGSILRPGRPLPQGKTRYPLYRRLCGRQGRSGRVRKISPPPGFFKITMLLILQYTNTMVAWKVSQ